MPEAPIFLAPHDPLVWWDIADHLMGTWMQVRTPAELWANTCADLWLAMWHA